MPSLKSLSCLPDDMLGLGAKIDPAPILTPNDEKLLAQHYFEAWTFNYVRTSTGLREVLDDDCKQVKLAETAAIADGWIDLKQGDPIPEGPVFIRIGVYKSPLVIPPEWMWCFVHAYRLP